MGEAHRRACKICRFHVLNPALSKHSGSFPHVAPLFYLSHDAQMEALNWHIQLLWILISRFGLGSSIALGRGRAYLVGTVRAT